MTQKSTILKKFIIMLCLSIVGAISISWVKAYAYEIFGGRFATRYIL
ncbi:hypothetical protein [Desnuesiella massiliensis]|nr:hypothetical protein [Desnuesiella massiliensis]